MNDCLSDIEEWLAPRKRVSTHEILDQLLVPISRGEEMRIARALRKRGWATCREKKDGRMLRVFENLYAEEPVAAALPTAAPAAERPRIPSLRERVQQIQDERIQMQEILQRLGLPDTLSMRCRVAYALQKRGYRRRQRRIEGVRYWFYVREPPPAPLLQPRPRRTPDEDPLKRELIYLLARRRRCTSALFLRMKHLPITHANQCRVGNIFRVTGWKRRWTGRRWVWCAPRNWARIAYDEFVTPRTL